VRVGRAGGGHRVGGPRHRAALRPAAERVSAARYFCGALLLRARALQEEQPGDGHAISVVEFCCGMVLWNVFTLEYVITAPDRCAVLTSYKGTAIDGLTTIITCIMMLQQQRILYY
jgi:hypothetical protein